VNPSVKEQLNKLRTKIIEPAPLLEHPVVQARIKGEFTLDQLRAIEIQHYYEAKYFSTFVLNAVKNCNDNLTWRKWMAENWVSEATGDKDHATLILNLLDALKVPRKKIDEAALETYQFHAEHDAQHGLQEEDIVVAALESDPNCFSNLRSICRDAYSAYIFSFDGYWQAATGKREFWSGVKPYI
jgi:pyrroloquinoline quinone (PQQ) biosynthesis protein C